MGSHKDKDRDKGQKSSKSKKEKREKKEKHKKEKHSRKRDRSSSSSDSSDSDVDTAQQQLERERAAINTLRRILWQHPDVRKELRAMLWQMDTGKATDISGVPDADLKAQIEQLFKLLKLRGTSKGVYGLASRSQQLLPVIGFVFDEPRPSQPPHGVQVPTTAALESAAQPLAAASKPVAGPSCRPETETGHERVGGPDPRVSPKPGPMQRTIPDVQDDEVPAVGAAAAAVAAAVASPQMPPYLPEPVAAGPAVHSSDGSDVDKGGQGHSTKPPAAPSAPSSVPAPAPRPTVGPAMPPPELLAAAAAAAAAMAAHAEAQASAPAWDDEMEGPLPPDMVEELDAVPQDAREAEVLRIMRIMQEAANACGKSAAVPVNPNDPTAHDSRAPDAYAILALAPDCTAAETKKGYMRLSLLIHPDKCRHAHAHAAFQAVVAAAKKLQDVGARAALDAAREDAELRKMAEAEAVRIERERAWRIARGEDTSDLPSLPGRAGGDSRDEWMTSLPPERVASKGPSQDSIRAFARTGIKTRGDTSMWTDTPEQQTARQAQALLTAATDKYTKQLMLPAAGISGPLGLTGPMGQGGHASLVDQYNSSSRTKSLMELHQEAQAQEQAKSGKDKKSKKAKTAGGSSSKGAGTAPTDAQGSGYDKSKHAWRPFDREKDLGIKPLGVNAADLMKRAGAIGSRFSGGETARSFL